MAQQRQTISLDTACAISAANTAAAAAAGTTSALAAVAHGLQPQPQAMTNERDPMLEAFEKYLLKSFEDRVFCVAQDSEGILLFNVNQVAYLVEGSATHEQQNSTRSRLKNAYPSITTTHLKCPRLGKGA